MAVKESQLERDFVALIKLFKLPTPQREYRFDQGGRRWRFDFAWPGQSVAVEIEGGTWTRGAHVRPLHFESDARKYNSAVIQGWKVLRFTGGMVRSGEAVRTLTDVLKGLEK